MKISTNFVRPVQRAVTPIAVAMWIAAAGFAGGAWWLLGEAAELRKDLPQLRQRLERVEKGNIAVAAKKQLPPAQDLADTRKRVAKINSATQTKGLTTSALLTELETQMPREVWLISIHHRAAQGEVVLVASATSADPLSAFLLKLERDPLFEEAMLMRELQSTGNAQPGMQFEIRLKVRS